VVSEGSSRSSLKQRLSGLQVSPPACDQLKSPSEISLALFLPTEMSMNAIPGRRPGAGLRQQFSTRLIVGILSDLRVDIFIAARVYNNCECRRFIVPLTVGIALSPVICWDLRPTLSRVVKTTRGVYSQYRRLYSNDTGHLLVTKFPGLDTTPQLSASLPLLKGTVP
jgi:hypothetical protein